MSVVYRGHDTALGRDVAVKVLHPHLAEKPESRQRLVQEARAVARLRHPNILDVYDFSAESAAEAYLVTEYIRGCTLKAFLERHPLSPPEIAALVIHGLADALACAHEAGVIHRDLKPDNVMVREDGALKLMDFGIAKLLDREERMTLTGALMGSPAHMAPEVIEGDPVGPAADIFSLGTMFYLFVTGRLPFLGPNPTATLKRILDGVYEDPQQLAPGLSRPLAEVMRRCLSRRPESRYPDAASLRDALADVLAQAGLERPEEERLTYFASPEIAGEVLTGRLVEHLLDRAQAALQARRVHDAIDDINQAQALAPEDPRGLSLVASLQEVQAQQRRRAGWTRAGIAAACLGVLGGGGWLWLETRPDASAASTSSPSSDSSPSLNAAVSGAAPVGASVPERSSAGASEPPPNPSSEGSQAPIGAPSPAGGTPSPNVTSSPPVRAATEATAAAAGVTTAIPSRRPGTRPRPPVANDAASPSRVPVRLLIRPWAHVAIDDGEYSEQGLQSLRLSLAPGPHRVRLRCPFCVDTEETITVTREGDQSFALATELAPARLSFSTTPPEATVEVQGEQRLAVSTRERPFLLRTPKGELPSPREVHYTVRMPGFQPRMGKVELNAGDVHTEHVKLDRP